MSDISPDDVRLLLRREREDKGLSEKDAASAAGVSLGVYSSFEAGGDLPLNAFCKIANRLGLDAGELLSGNVRGAIDDSEYDPSLMAGNIKTARENHRLSPAEVSKRSFIDEKRLSSFEKGEGIPTVDEFLRLCGALGYPPRLLLGGTLMPRSKPLLDD